MVIDEGAARTFDFAYEMVFLGDDEEDTRPLSDHTVDPALTDRFIRMSAERTSAPLNGNYVAEVLRRRRIAVQPVTYVAVGEAAVDRGPRPIRAADGSVVTGPLSAMVKQLGREERVIARYFAAPVG